MPELDMRTVSFLVSFFALCFGAGLWFFHREQRHYQGINLVAWAQIAMSVGVGLIFLRGAIPIWSSVIAANLLLCCGMTLALFGFSRFRLSDNVFGVISAIGLLGVLLGLVYFLFYQPSINARVALVSLHLGITQLLTSVVIYRGKAVDSAFPRNILATVFAGVALTMFIRTGMVLYHGELNHYMSAGWMHQVPYLASMFLIMAMSFNLVWLVNGRLMRSVESLSMRDNLTSLYNRRGMDKIAAKMANATFEDDRPLVAMMCDIDRFKSINDQFGHLTGDQVISQVSEQIRMHVRVNDVAIRYGGEEFLIILPSTTLKDAQVIAERIRVAIHAMPPLNARMGALSVSIGLAVQQPNQDFSSLIGDTDVAMYQAKQKGRNCIVTYNDKVTYDDKMTPESVSA
ncbi:GGDEF domain-containing protein [Vibrio sp. SM6]|uniref:diguanylate cyclase n=1 Tax=Vibrio agarilyticus TaxID=2726741 RepID=A0A7X8TNB4_9VIBR|nr:GGDEF domain-containing protein [Vibrio agarilyticus]NLS11901.1 GGDEF domain-containing protein [Vibrio agarilyticus]